MPTFARRLAPTRNTRPRQRSILAAAALSLAGAPPPHAAAADPTHSDIIYASIADRPLRLDLYLPEPDLRGPVPLVLYVHGGGWLSGDKRPLPAALGTLLDHGIAVAGVQYRLTSQAWMFGGVSPIFPAQIHDLKAAVRWVRTNGAGYGIDPERVAAWGMSAGGHLAALLGTSAGVVELEGPASGGVSTRLSAVVDYFGPTDILFITTDRRWPPGGIDHDVRSSPESKLMGWSQPGQGLGDIRSNLANPAAPYPQLVARCVAANPTTHVSPDDPPFFIAHGTSDTIVPLLQSIKLADALGAAGVAVEYHPIAGAPHDDLGAATDQAAVAFLVRTLLDPPSPDLNGDGRVDVVDLVGLIGQWGACAAGAGCTGDLDHDRWVGVPDLLRLITAWTP
jgi:acetyl esterase/lipase